MTAKLSVVFVLLSALLMPAAASQRVVAVYIFEGVELLDFAGPLEAFSIAEDSAGKPIYKVCLVTKDGKPVKTQNVLKAIPTHSLKNCPTPDILVIPGGDVADTAVDAEVRSKFSQWMSQRVHTLSVCNGATVLASMGKLASSQIATHRSNFEIVKAIDPSIQIDESAKVVSRGMITTSAGISSGIDGALYLIAVENGLDVAKRACIDMEFLYWPGLKAASLDDFVSDKDGFKVQTGGVREREKSWAIYEIIESLSVNEDAEDSVSLYKDRYAAAKDHDKEMIEPASLEENALWLFTIAKNKGVPLRMAQLNAICWPNRAEAFVCLGKIQSKVGQRKEAKQSVEQALKLSPTLKSALDLKRYLERGTKK